MTIRSMATMTALETAHTHEAGTTCARPNLKGPGKLCCHPKIGRDCFKRLLRQKVIQTVHTSRFFDMFGVDALSYSQSDSALRGMSRILCTAPSPSGDTACQGTATEMPS